MGIPPVIRAVEASSYSTPTVDLKLLTSSVVSLKVLKCFCFDPRFHATAVRGFNASKIALPVNRSTGYMTIRKRCYASVLRGDDDPILYEVISASFCVIEKASRS